MCRHSLAHVIPPFVGYAYPTPLHRRLYEAGPLNQNILLPNKFSTLFPKIIYFALPIAIPAIANTITDPQILRRSLKKGGDRRFCCKLLT